MYANPWRNDYYKEEVQAKRHERNVEFCTNQSINDHKAQTYETRKESKTTKIHKQGNGNKSKLRQKKKDWWNSAEYYRRRSRIFQNRKSEYPHMKHGPHPWEESRRKEKYEGKRYHLERPRTLEEIQITQEDNGRNGQAKQNKGWNLAHEQIEKECGEDEGKYKKEYNPRQLIKVE